jgi:hypothetical protein
MVAYGVDHGVDDPLNVVKGYGKPPTHPSSAKISPKETIESGVKREDYLRTIEALL